MAQNTLAIVGAQLIDGTGAPPVQNSFMLIKGNRIVAVGENEDIVLPLDAKIIEAHGKSVMPGLIDLSVRFSKLGHLYHDSWDEDYGQRMRDEIIPLAAAIVLKAGVTSARNVGGNFADMEWLRECVLWGDVAGPRLSVCGAGLRKTEGGRAYYDYELVGNPTEAREIVKKLVDKNVDVIKILAEQFEEDELAAIVEEAHRHGKPIDASVHTIKTMRRILNINVGKKDTLFHFGLTLADPEFSQDIVDRAIDTGVGIVPTMIAGDGLRQIVANPEIRNDPQWKVSLPPDIWKDIYQSYAATSEHSLYEMSVSTHQARLSRIRQLKDAGLRLDFGTDSGIRGNPHHAAVWREMLEFTHVGLSPHEVIQAATSHAAWVIGKDNELGTIEVGKLADVIIIDGDPLQDIAMMKHVAHVIQDGKIVY